MAQLLSVSPVSNEDTTALPVKEIGPAVAYYESVLGFRVIGRTDSTAALERDRARIGLARQPDHRPHEAGSLGFGVDDLDALHVELSGRGGNPGDFGIQQWNGRRYRTFFMREDRDGYCYCFYRELAADPISPA